MLIGGLQLPNFVLHIKINLLKNARTHTKQYKFTWYRYKQRRNGTAQLHFIPADFYESHILVYTIVYALMHADVFVRVYLYMFVCMCVCMPNVFLYKLTRLFYDAYACQMSHKSGEKYYLYGMQHDLPGSRLVHVKRWCNKVQHLVNLKALCMGYTPAGPLVATSIQIRRRSILLGAVNCRL